MLTTDLARNPYFLACPIYGMRSDGNALTASSFIARAKDASLHLVIAAHLAANRSENLESDRSSWFSELWLRTSPPANWLKVALFEDVQLHERPLFNCTFDDGGLLDALSIRIPKTLENHFGDVNVVDTAKMRAPKDREDVIFFGFPLVSASWPLPFATPSSGHIAASHMIALREGNRLLDGGFSGSAVFAAMAPNGQPNDLIGMIIGGEGQQGVIMPGDLIACIVNDEPLPRNSPAHVREGKLRVRA